MTTRPPARVTILAAVICDDVRHEKNGKDILVGAYSSNIAVHTLPNLAIPLRCWINVRVDGPCKLALHFRARDHKENEIFKNTTNMETDEEVGLGALPLGPIIYSLHDPEGRLEIDYREGEGDWINVITKTVLYQSP